MRAGREQAMAAMSCAADTAGAMLHGQCAPEAELRDAPQMPPSAAHQVSPVASTAPPAVAPPVTGPSERTSLVAGSSGMPAAEPQNQSAVQMNEGAPPSSRSQAAIKSYSPANIVKKKIPAVTACDISSDVHMQAMQGAWNSQLAVADEDKPKQQQEAKADKAEDKSSQSSQQEPELSSRETSAR